MDMGERILVGAIRGLTVLAALAVVVMMVGTDYDVVARLVANKPLRGVVELVEIMVLVSAMLALPETFLRDEQIQIDLLDSMLPARVLAAVKCLAVILSFVFLVLLSFHVYAPLYDAYRFGDIKPELGVPVYLLYAVILCSFLASALACIIALRRLLGGSGDIAETGGTPE